MIMSDVGSAVTPAQGAAVQLSRNETEALCLKAARGRGMSWGLAEEAGFAAGWLGAQGVDGASALLQLLDAEGDAGIDLARNGTGAWQAVADGILCPIRLGAALLDHSALSGGPLGGLTTGKVGRPVLLVPFLAEATLRLRGGVALSCDGVTLTIDHGRPDPGALALLAPLEAGAIRLAPAGSAAPPPQQPAGRPAIAAETIAALAALALRTTVPATEASRSGAGAAEDDND